MKFRSFRRSAFPLALACGIALGGVPAVRAETGPDQVIEQYRAWTVTCNRTGAADAASTAPETCRMEQSIQEDGSGATVMRISIAAGPETPAPVGVILGPFGVDLARGLVLTIDGTASDPIAYKTCLPSGCLADLPLDEARLAALRAGETLIVSLRPVDNPENEIALTFSLNGFGDALTRVKAAAP